VLLGRLLTTPSTGTYTMKLTVQYMYTRASVRQRRSLSFPRESQVGSNTPCIYSIMADHAHPVCYKCVKSVASINLLRLVA
jgi:hypothetical protein